MLAFAAAIGFIVVLTADAVDAQRAISQYVHDEWGSDKGYPGGHVYAVTQTTDGYLWVGADKGLVRFDGRSFRLFEPTNPATSAGPTVLGVAAAPDGSLWARLRGVALMRYDRGTFENIIAKVGPPESVVSAMIRGRDDAMLVATVGRGAVAYRGGRFDLLVQPTSMPRASFVVIAIAEARDGVVWLGTRDAGLFRVQAGTMTRITEGLPDLKVNCLLAGDNGELWIGTDKGIARWTGHAVTRSGIPAGVQDVPALAMIRDRASSVWIAAGSKGLVRVNADGTARSPAARDSSDRFVSTVFEDRDGNLWVGTDRAIERWRDPMFTTYSTEQGLPPGGVGAIYVDEAGRTWFGPTSGGLFWIQNGEVHRVTDTALNRDVIYSIDGGGGEVWVGRQRGGLTRLRPSANGFTTEHFTRTDGLPQDSVYVVSRARDGAVWAGTLSGGASRLRHRTVTTYDTASGLAANAIASILEASDGTMWFATPNGLSAFSRGGWRTYTATDGLPANDVHTLFEDRGGNLWIGTAAGIAVLRAGRIQPLTDLPLVLRGSILGLADDRTGSLWVKTAERVLRIDRSALLHGAVEGQSMREYGIADGLLATESVKRHRAIVGDARGRVWMTLNRGLSVADPTAADGRTLEALIHVDSLSADGVAVDINHPISLPSSRRRIAFGYTGVSLSVPERVMYRYRLDGFDGEWSEPSHDRQAVYTNLGPGPYSFRVVASNSDGLWNSREAVLSFEIQPAFWQTASFKILAVVLGIATVWGLYRLRLRQMSRQLQVRFEERLAERTRIAQELHDTLLQGFVSASMQLHVAADRLPDDSPSKPAIGGVIDLMSRVIDEGRNAVRGLRSSAGEPHDLGRAFSGIQQELAAGHQSAYRVIVNGRPTPLKPAIRDEIYRIGREGVVNAFLHAGASSIEIELEYAPGELRLFVRDDGKGIETQVVQTGTDGHWGITGMRERAERIGGSLKIRSRAAAGTEVELRVPGRLAFDRAGGEATFFAHVFGRVAAALQLQRPEKHS